MTTKKTPDLPDKSAYVHTHTLPDGTTYAHSHAHGSKAVHDHESAADSDAAKGSNHSSDAGISKQTGSAEADGSSSKAAASVSSAASGSSVDPDKLIALLTFFVGHNEQHAGELAELIPALPEAIQDKMMLAIGTLEAANVDLQCVLDYLIAKEKEG